MPAPPTTAQPKPMTLERAQYLLQVAINGTAESAPPPHIANNKPEVQQRINAHFKAVTGKMQAIYINSDDDEKNKVAIILHCVRALTRDAKKCHWEDLQGQDAIGKGDKRADPLAVVPAAPTPKTNQDSVATPPAQSFATRCETPVVLDKSRMSPIAAAVFAEIEPWLPKPEAAEGKTNEDDVRAIVNEGLLDLPDKVKGVVDKHLANGGFPSSRVQELINSALDGLATRVVIETPQGTTRTIERQHYKFPLLLTALNAGLNVALVGPAGSGKTYSAHAAARALEMEFAATSFGPMTSKADLFGMINAHGVYRETDLVRLAVKGGVFLGDEFDAGNAGVGTYLNMLTANSHFGTPDGMKVKSDKFRMVIGMNTYGLGANRVYVGRNQMDGATLDRYAFIEWPYDEGLEAHTVGITAKSPKFELGEGGVLKAKEWLDYVQKVRAACDKLAIRQIISPRCTQMGVALFDAKVGRTHVENMVLWKGTDEATKVKIKGAL